MFARDREVQRRFVTGETGDDWQRSAFVGNWFLELTPAEADELGRRVFALVDLLRRLPSRDDAVQAFVSVNVLPVLGDGVSSRA